MPGVPPELLRGWLRGRAQGRPDCTRTNRLRPPSLAPGAPRARRVTAPLPSRAPLAPHAGQREIPPLLAPLPADRTRLRGRGVAEGDGPSRLGVKQLDERAGRADPLRLRAPACARGAPPRRFLAAGDEGGP